MKKKLLLFSIQIFVVFLVFGQNYVDLPWNKGVLFVDGKEIEGMIRLPGGKEDPWLNQKKVYYVKMKDFSYGKKLKRKNIIEFKPDKIDGYTVGDFVYVSKEIKVVSGIMLKKKKKKFFLQVMEDGPIAVFKYYKEPPKTITTSKKDRYEERQEYLENPFHYLQKEDEDLVDADECDLVTYLSDCSEVADKVAAGDYGFTPSSERKKRKGLGKLLSNALQNNALHKNILQVIVDFNKCKN